MHGKVLKNVLLPKLRYFRPENSNGELKAPSSSASSAEFRGHFGKRLIPSIRAGREYFLSELKEEEFEENNPLCNIEVAKPAGFRNTTKPALRREGGNAGLSTFVK